MLRFIQVSLNHLFDGAGSVTQIAILRQIDCAHPSATYAPHNLVTAIQERGGIELLDRGLVAACRVLANDRLRSILTWFGAGSGALQYSLHRRISYSGHRHRL